jgi:hypothetical protein
MDTAWLETKKKLFSKYRFLEPFIPTVEAATIEQIETLLDSCELRTYRYEPLLVENHLSDCSLLLDRCLAYRREARDFEIEAVSFALEYEKSNEVLDVEELLEQEVSEEALLTNEGMQLAAAANVFMQEGSGLAQGFAAQTAALSAASSARSLLWKRKTERLVQRRAITRKWQEAYKARHEAPGSAHNYVERMRRVVRLLAEDLHEAHCKAAALFSGMRIIYGEKFALPVLQDGVIDELVLGVRRVSRYLDAARQTEMSYDVVIPLCQPWSQEDTAIITEKDLKTFLKNAKTSSLPFTLKGVFFNQEFVRIKAVGLSFGNTSEAFSPVFECKYQKPLSSKDAEGDSGEAVNGASTTEVASSHYAKYRLRVTLHTPQQLDTDGKPYSRPPIVFGNMAVFGGSAPVAVDDGANCRNLCPLGLWRLIIESNVVSAGADREDVWHWGASIIHDLKLHLRVSARFTSGDSAFRPITEQRRL